MVIFNILMYGTVLAICGAIVMGFYKVVCTIFLGITDNVSEEFKLVRAKRIAKHKSTMLTSEVIQHNYFGLTFSRRRVFEQEYYLNKPFSNRRLTFDQANIAPELQAAKVITPVIFLTLKKFLP